MRITAAVTEEAGAAFVLASMDLLGPGPGEVLVRVVSAGVCHTDILVRDQLDPVSLPAVLGHEGAGVVHEVGDGVQSVRPGDHVVLSFSSCGRCSMCDRGRSAYCDHFYESNFGGRKPDGSTPLSRHGEAVTGWFFGQSSFATFALASENSVVKVDRGAPLELLGPLGCGIQTGAGAVLNSLRPEAGTSLAVFGTGSVGLSAVMGAVIAGCTTIVAVDLNDGRLELALELGATHSVNPGRDDPVNRIRELTAGRGLDFSIDTTAVPSVLRSAVDVLAVGGVCGSVGGAAPGSQVNLDMESLLFGRTVKGIIEGDSVPRTFIPRLVQLQQQGRFPFEKLIRLYPLHDINRAVEDSFERNHGEARSHLSRRRLTRARTWT